MNNVYFQEAIKQANKSKSHLDVPVGAVIVKNNKIISKGYNTREKKGKVINHAEIVAILKANKVLKSYFLYDCDLYVTLEPCAMCKNIINNSRIRNVFYLVKKTEEKKEYDKTVYKYVENEYSKLSIDKLKKFFGKLR